MLRLVRCCLLCLFVFLSCAPARAAMDPYKWAARDIGAVRDAKVAQLKGHLDHLRELAGRAAEDEIVKRVFAVQLAYARGMAEGGVPEEFAAQVAELDRNFGSYYLEHYFAFYDILFIASDGKVFSTVRKEADLGRVLIGRDRMDTPLAERLNARPAGPEFVDFFAYGPSNEPAAFFVLPMDAGDGATGWIALQCPINRLNAMFTSSSELGGTVETFLVNRAGYMLTESHFMADSSILRQHLSDDNVSAKFKAGKGFLEITDYRHRHALSSFEVVSFMGAKWLVVVKVDKDEVLTSEYRSHRDYYAGRFRELVRGRAAPRGEGPAMDAVPTAVRVDMDEFAKATGKGRLQTWGVSTCTAILVGYPGRFAYLAHVSNADALYGGTRTNLLGQILRNLERFDVSEIEKPKLRFVLLAPHLRTLQAVVDRLVDEGFHLSQIYVVTAPDAASGALAFDCASDALYVRFKGTGGAAHYRRLALENVPNLGELMSRAVAETYRTP